MLYQNILKSLVVIISVIMLVSCAHKSKKDLKNTSREVAQHVEQTGEGEVITKIFEERDNGIYTIRIQVIKDGNVKETIHYFDSDNFSISVPVSAHIMVQNVKEAGKRPDTNVLVFTQKLELARQSMLETDYIGALEALNEALKIDSYNPQAHMMKGSIFYSMGKTDLAKKEFEYVLKVDPDNIEVKRFKEFMDSEEESSSRKVKIEGIEEQ